MTSPLDRVRDGLERRECRPVRSGRGFSARCPAHEDNRASLSVSEGDDGKALVRCFAGCEPGDIVAALGLELSDLFPPKEPKRKTKSGPGRIVQTYDYTDESGTLLYQVVRFEPKDFRPRRPDPTRKDGWTWDLKEARRVLYRLPEVLAAIPASCPVFLTEGEKDADAVAALGLTVTTHSGGAKGWKPEHAASLRGAHVVVLSDDDEPGREHGRAVAQSLHGTAASVRVLNLGRPGVKDAADWIAAGGTREELERLAAEAPEWQPVAAPTGHLLAEIARHVRRFVVLSLEQATLCALWTLHAHAVEAADVTPYLIVTSPERRCGKSRLLEVLRALAPKPWYVVRPSESVLFRKLATGATLFLDEFDAIFSTAAKDSTEGIRATLNAGFERGAVVSRCADHGRELEDFQVFGPKVLAGIGDPPDTVKDRGFVLSLRRARRSETRERFRRRKAGPVADELRGRIESWAGNAATLAALKVAEPVLPEQLNDRAQDAAEALLALADLAGGEWPEKARAALVGLAGAASEDEVGDSSGVALLRDLVTAFERLGSPKHAASEILVRELRETEGAPWAKLDHGEGLDQTGIARLLRPFQVRSRNVKTADDRVRRGYRRADILDAAERYVPAVPTDPEEDTESGPWRGAATGATALQAARGATFQPLPDPLPDPLPYGPSGTHGSRPGEIGALGTNGSRREKSSALVAAEVAGREPAQEAESSGVAEVALPRQERSSRKVVGL